MNKPDLKSRLDALSERIDRAEARMKLKSALHDGHAQTMSTLRQRYAALSEKVNAETADAEAHGHHVSDLERSVRQWLDSLEMEID